MKKLFRLSSLFAAAALMTACSNDEPAPGNDEISNGEPRYLAVTITSGTDSRSRAEGDDTTPATDPDYEHGEAGEYKINSVDLYFFDAAGNAAQVKADGTNTMEMPVEETNKEEGSNISNASNAVIVINTPPDKKIPAQIVAVVNSTEDYSGKSIAQLQEEVTEGGGGTSFVMTNSVYVAGNALHVGAEVAGHLFTDRDAALASPVTIYVERTLAKVRVNSKLRAGKTLADGTVLYNPNNEESGKTETFNEKQIYVKFLGWNTTVRSTKNRLVKVIDPNWNAGWSWYDPYRFRSFWAINASGNKYENFDFDQEDDAANAIKKFDGSAWTYLKENAGASKESPATVKPSQVIIAAQLVDENGDYIEMAEYGGIRMTVADLKTAFANAASLYYKKENGEDTDGNKVYVYTKIVPGDIEIITATASASAKETDSEVDPETVDKRYLVYATLTADAAKKVWYAKSLNDAVNNPPLTLAQVKANLVGLGGAKVWTEGKTYYYFDIQHLAQGVDGAAFGQLGVVRNHVYDARLNKLTGLGTPVYDPDEVIYTEPTYDDQTFIAAEIKVLSWRVVNSDIDLEW